MADNIGVELCVNPLKHAFMNYSRLYRAVIYSDHGNQYTSEKHRTTISKYHIQQSINNIGGKYYDNAHRESMRARKKE